MSRIVSVATGWSPRLRRTVLVVLAVLAIAAMSAAVVAVRADSAADARATSAQDGREFAVNVVPSLLSYDYDTAEAHFADVANQLGGDFRGQFEEVGRTVIVPSALERKVVTSAEVIESSVVNAGADDAELLLFLNQSTTSADAPETKLDGSRVKVRVERVDGTWLITELTPV